MTNVLSTSFFSRLFKRIKERHNPITDSWFLMNPVHMATLVVSYLLFVLYLGPKLMRNRPPMNLKHVMIAYNVIQIITNVYFVLVIVKEVILPGYLNVFCEGDHEGIESLNEFARNTIHLFFMSRVFDFCDTIFMVLKKKDKQLSFLHIYHHLLMGTFSWLGVYVEAGRHAVVLGVLNCTVHSVMYFYYLLMLVSPKYSKSIWWKKHITQLQLLQFIILLVQHTGALINPHCNEDVKQGEVIAIPQLLIIIMLFGNFYYNEYVKAKPAVETNKNK